MKTKRFPVALIEKLDKLHAGYTLDLFTDEPVVENPTPEVLAVLRQWDIQKLTVALIEKLDKLHAGYTLDLFTDEPVVENPTPEVLAVLRQWEVEQSHIL